MLAKHGITLPPKPRKRKPAIPAASEHDHAKSLMQRVAIAEGQYPDLKHLFAVPNGGERNVIVARKMKAEGVKKGVPDYVLPVRRGNCPGLVLELKNEIGSASSEQREWLEHFRSEGWEAHVCRGWESAWARILEYVQR